MGVKIVSDVDKSGFTAIADPYLDKLAKDLGPHAEKIKDLVKAINSRTPPSWPGLTRPSTSSSPQRESKTWMPGSADKFT